MSDSVTSSSNPPLSTIIHLRMKDLGLQHFRVEFLRESPAGVAPLLNNYARVLSEKDDGRATWRQLRVLNQLGITRGTLNE